MRLSGSDDLSHTADNRLNSLNAKLLETRIKADIEAAMSKTTTTIVLWMAVLLFGSLLVA